MNKYNMGDYKVGDWLIDKRLNKLAEIIEIYEDISEEQIIVVKYYDTSYYMTRTTNVSKINKLFTKSKAARLLHKK